MSIIRGMDVKLNVRPMFIGLQHLVEFEGPCRFGAGEELTPEYDTMMNQELFKRFVEDVKANVPDCVNLLEPIYVERTDEFFGSNEMWEAFEKGMHETDLYIFSPGIGRDDIPVDFAQRYKKDTAIVPYVCCSTTTIYAAADSRGLNNIYAYIDWEEAKKSMTALRTKKALRKTNVLQIVRGNSTISYSSADTFPSLEKVTQKFGTHFVGLNVHELLDQMEVRDRYSNPSLPGRPAHNITPEEEKEIYELTDDLMKNADNCPMDREQVFKTVKGYYTVKKMLDLNGCNAFTAPCPDMCATRRFTESGLTLCMTHSLLNEQAIPSACEYDIDGLLCMMILGTISGKAPYLGNVNPVLFDKGKVKEMHSLFEEDIMPIKDKENLYYIFHSVPNRKLKGFDKPAESYSIQPFAYDRKFGATFRYDYSKDKDQEVTLIRISPDCEKIFIGKGSIVKAIGYEKENCAMGAVFRVKDQKDFFHKQLKFGNHCPMVYGDYVEEITMLADSLGLEVVKSI